MTLCSCGVFFYFLIITDCKKSKSYLQAIEYFIVEKNDSMMSNFITIYPNVNPIKIISWTVQEINSPVKRTVILKWSGNRHIATGNLPLNTIKKWSKNFNHVWFAHKCIEKMNFGYQKLLLAHNDITADPTRHDIIPNASVHHVSLTTASIWLKPWWPRIISWIIFIT